MKLLQYILLLLVVFFIMVSCGKGSSSDSEITYNVSLVLYDVDSSLCLVSANNYNDMLEIRSGSHTYREYIWDCGLYKDQNAVQISLRFYNNGDGSDCLRLENETVTDGRCS